MITTQQLSDIIAALGSRIGIGISPASKTAYLMRNGSFPGVAFKLQVGIQLAERTLLLPLCTEGEAFHFLDQEMTPTSLTLSGIDPATGLHLKLRIMTPFRPQDVQFSTTPALFFEVELNRLKTRFRWVRMNTEKLQGRLFVKFDSTVFSCTAKNGNLFLNYSYPYERPDETALNPYMFTGKSTDCIALASGSVTSQGLETDFSLNPGERADSLRFAWCVFDKPILKVQGEYTDFKYKQFFQTLDSVALWAKEQFDTVKINSQRVDGIISGHNLGIALTHLMSQALHTWLANTWWTVLPNGQDWFTVWEGGGYFHSSMDVEFTQAPFYIHLWPQLLGLQLDQWAAFPKDGMASLGERGRNTAYLSHDLGEYCNCDGQKLWIDQELEENANYLLMLYTYWRITGQDALLYKHQALIHRLLEFIAASDSDGDGVPDLPCHNTLDDAPTPLKTSDRLTYIAVKSLCAYETGAEMLRHLGGINCSRYTKLATKCRNTIEQYGWLGDHYAAKLDNSEGADCYHIYTAHALALLGMVNFDCGLSYERLKQDFLTSMQATIGRYGCRHCNYEDNAAIHYADQGALLCAPFVGWVSMNMTRDIAAAYYGIDLTHMLQRYWNWQCTVNSQDYLLFCETFYGNNLIYYPRGLAVFGYLQAAIRLRLDRVSGTETVCPLREGVQVPLLHTADWFNGTVTYFTDNQTMRGNL